MCNLNHKREAKYRYKSARKALTIAFARESFGLIYAAILLAIVGLFLANMRLSNGMTVDRITNSHLRFQSALFLRSLEDIAQICANKPNFTKGRFDFGGGYVGGFFLQGSSAYLYVEAKNLRTGQILRATKEILLRAEQKDNLAERNDLANTP